MSGNVVFISYAHESDEHRERVRSLARALLQAGWDVRLDRYVGYPPEQWPRWMAHQIEEADRILCVCTATYRLRFEGDQARGGLGVSWEGYLLSGMLYRLRSRRRNVIPIWPIGRTPEDGAAFLPTVLRPLDGLAFDEAAIVARLGVVGEPRGEPVHTEGWRDPGAMDRHLILGQLYEPIGAKRGRGPNDVVPSTFFRPRHAIVPFEGREAHLADLDAWCLGAGVSVRAMHGPGGAGKTRLALELAARRAAEGWRAGPLVRNQVTPERVDEAVKDPIPLLVIIDYAEGHAKDASLLLTAALAKSMGTVRVLLLCRHVGEWLENLCVDVPFLRDVLGPALELRDGEPGTVARAAAAFAHLLDLPPPSTLPEDAGTTLDRHVDGYLAVVGAPGSGILGLVDHEKRYLRQVASDVGLAAPVVNLLPDAVALATLVQGIPGGAYVAWLKLVPGLEDQPKAVVRLVGRVLKDLYPAEDGGVAPIQPDGVGEVYVETVDRDGELAALAVDQGRATQALTVLTRLAQRGGVDRPLRVVLEARLEKVLEAVCEVAVALGDPIGSLAAEVLERRGDVGLAERLLPLLPEQSVALRELAVAATRMGLTGLGTVDGGSEDYHLSERARRLNNLGNRLSDLGCREEALAATAEAVELSRDLAARSPDAFLPDLARSLNNLGNRLSALGRREEALSATAEAVELYRGLAARRPDVFAPDLAMSLNNLGHMLSALGRREAALAATAEAAELYRGLAAHRSDAFLPNVAATLINLGIQMSALGRREAALVATAEAVDLRRGLAARRPDAFWPDLAMSLNNLGADLSDLGRREEALAATAEAVDVCRGLAARRPDVFLPDLAGSLNNLGNRLSALGRREDALAATAEAVDLRRGLAARRPDVFRPDLAISLMNLGHMLSDLGRREEALVVSAEAVDMYRGLAAHTPDAFLPDLARSLNNLGNRLWALDRREEALAATAEAVDLRRNLAARRPDAFWPDLAMSLGAMGQVLLAADRPSDAAASFHEGIALLLPFALRHPRAHAGMLGALARDYNRACEAAGLTPDPSLLALLPGVGPEPKQKGTLRS